MKRATKHTTRHHAGPIARHVVHPRAPGVLLREDEFALAGVSPGLAARLTGGDVDADWARAWDSGDEAVGGSSATPDQDVVDQIGRALGVEQEADAEVWTSRDILAERDRHRWDQEA
jgi:hypothetical protein